MNIREKVYKYVAEDHHYYRFQNPNDEFDVLFLRSQEIDAPLRGKLIENEIYILQYRTGTSFGMWFCVRNAKMS